MDQGEGIEGAALKEDPLDFALWKAQKEGEDTAWDAPWGRGRPGWHIECSAMAEKLLGLEFDVHGGGIDLLFPHHENEAAQTMAGRGRPLARVWMHNGMLQLEGEKMAKSVGNIRSLAGALDHAGRDALILYFVSGHYRQPIAFSEELLDNAARGVARIREAGRRLVAGPSPEDMAPLKERFFAALADDFNTPEALAAVYDWVREANRRDEGTVGDATCARCSTSWRWRTCSDEDAAEGPDADALALAQEREDARAAGDYARADALRDALLERGWQVRDGSAGPELLPR